MDRGAASLRHTSATVLCLYLLLSGHTACAIPESFVRGGPTLTTFFFSLMRGGRI